MAETTPHSDLPAPAQEVPQALVYTEGDYERLGTMKKASDVVFDYFRWATEDHRRISDHKSHTAKVSSTIEHVEAVFSPAPAKRALVPYFIANVLQALQELEYQTDVSQRWAPFSKEDLSELFNADEVSAIQFDSCVQDRAMYAGRFVSEATEVCQDIDRISRAEVVGCDSMLVVTLSWPLLLEGCSIEDDGGLGCVGRALAVSSAITQELYESAERSGANCVTAECAPESAL